MRKKLVVAFIIFIFAIVAVDLFRQSQQRVKGIQTEKMVQGIVLPHHGFAREVLVDSYGRLNDEQYDLVVVIGPNHFYQEFGEVITSDSESGINVPESLGRKIVEGIDGVKVNNEVVEGEHSIGIHTQYLDEYFPDAEILPIVVPPSPDEEDIESLVNILSEFPAKTLFIASVDFAHDMTYLEALENDKESINAIRSFDYDMINTFDDQHMDSPKSIVVLLKIMQKLNATDFHVLHDTHGALLIDDPTLKGTSYVVGVFEK